MRLSKILSSKLDTSSFECKARQDQRVTELDMFYAPICNNNWLDL